MRDAAMRQFELRVRVASERILLEFNIQHSTFNIHYSLFTIPPPAAAPHILTLSREYDLRPDGFVVRQRLLEFDNTSVCDLGSSRGVV